MLLNITRRASSGISLLFPVAVVVMCGWLAYLKIAAPDTLPMTAAGELQSPGRATPDAPPASVERSSAAGDPSGRLTRTGDSALIAAGDTLKLAFYERLISEEDKWSARSFSKRPPTSFQQRTELSGDYDVREDGVVIVPLLGAFNVGGRTVSQFETEAKSAFEELIGRFAFMSVTLDRRPIYVVGPVKKPGFFKFAEGLTVFHVVALAGGFDRPAFEVGHMLEAFREAEKIQKSADKLKRLRAKLIVLEAERDGQAAAPSRDLLKLISETEARQIVEAELSTRALALRNREAHAEAQTAAIQAARTQLKSRRTGRDHVQTSIAVRANRVSNLNQLGDKIGRPIRAQAEAELSDVRARMMDFTAAANDAEVRLNQLLQDQITFRNDAKLALLQEITDLQAQIADASTTTSASTGALDAMRIGLVGRTDTPEGEDKFQIVRGADANRQVLTVSGEELVRPGDLIRVLSD